MRLNGMAKKKIAALLAGCMLLGAGAVLAAPKSAPAEKAELYGDSVEYNSKSGLMTADGNVKMVRGNAVATGEHAEYNTKNDSGLVSGNVVADQEDRHLTCDVFRALSKTEFVATGNVHAVKGDRSVDGSVVEYNSETGYGRLPEGGTVGAQGGTLTADYIEGWEKEQHVKARGNVLINHPARNFRGGGDEGEYFGLEDGKTILQGNAWAIQDNNTLRSPHMVIYLNEKKTDKAAAAEAPAEEKAAQ